MRFLKTFCLTISTAFVLSACVESYTPRPYGYFRVDLPAHAYRTIDTLGLPYKFQIPRNAKLVGHDSPNEKYSIDINYPTLNANIFCSYMPVKSNLVDLLEESRKFVYKHSVRADGINEKAFENIENDVHGILYDLKGNTASSVQFLVTDSSSHFFRGALYFNNVPNKDSIAPMTKYIREDIIKLIESFEWKK